MNWYVKSSKDGRVFGPYPKQQLIEKINTNSINQKEYLFSQDQVRWYETFLEKKQSMLGKYKILRELGRGGMGVVYHAIDTSLNRECALKVLSNNHNSSAAVERFFNEARAIAQINHPNIIKIHEIHTQPTHFFAMEYIPGQTLSVYLSTRRFKQNEKLQLFLNICDAISHAHSHKIIHRDLKPDNILIRENGIPVILDFGIAKDSKATSNLTQQGEIMGTPRYIAPEIVLEQPVDHRSDIYSLGVILYQMLTGRPPFDVDNFFSLVHVLTTKEPLPLSQLNTAIPKNSDIEILCLKTLEKKPLKRIQSAEYLKSQLQKIIDGQPISLRKPTIIEQVVRWYRGSGIVGRIVVMLIIATVILLTTTFLAFRSVEKAKQQALKTIASVQQKKKEANDTIIEIAQRVPQIIRTGQLQQALLNLQRAFTALDDSFTERTTKKNKEIYRRLTNTLQFSVLTNLPQVFQAEIKGQDGPLHISKGGKFIWGIQDGFLHMWKTSHIQKNTNLSNSSKLKIGSAKLVQFSPNDSFIVYTQEQKIYFYDFNNQKKYFIQNSAGPVILYISENSRFLAYNIGQTKICVYDLKLQKHIARFRVASITGGIKVSNDGESVAILGEQSFSLYSVKKAKLYTMQDPNSFSFGCKFIFDNKRYLYILSAFGLTIYDCKNYTKKFVANPYGSTFIKSEPVTVDDRLIFGTDQGNMISYFREKDLRPHRFIKFPSLLREVVKKIRSTTKFLCVHKGNILQIRNILSLETTFSTPYQGNSIHFEQKSSGHVLKTIHKNNYIEYRFSSQILHSTKEVSTVLKKLHYASDELKQIMRKIEIASNKNTIILPHQLGFLAWSDNQFSIQYDLKKGMPLSFGFNKQKSKIALVYDNFKIDILHTQNLSLYKSILISIPNAAGRPRNANFIDEENLLITTTMRNVLLCNIPSKICKTYALKVNAKAIFLRKFMDYIFIGTKHGFDIFDIQKETLTTKFRITLPLFYCFAVAETKSIFASGDVNGEIAIWKNFKKIKSFKVPGRVNSLSFSPNGEYLAIFTPDSFFIYDLKLQQLSEAYIGYFKSNISNISDDWSSIYFPVDLGDIIVFDQNYFFNYSQQKKRIKDYSSINDKYNPASLINVMDRIRKKLNLHNEPDKRR
ncbi:protein kinase [Candidatus Uabimicrobium sp. HlEnr_7]|uniref:serine/threonine-protein kinase n=1 Tax=Candidatus Uabimicrobium helgolandensis TaxID=3095367 RepID=UPI0035582CA2